MTHRIVLGAIASAALIASTVGCAGSTPSGLMTTTTVTAPPTAAGTPAGYALLDVQIGTGRSADPSTL